MCVYRWKLTWNCHPHSNRPKRLAAQSFWCDRPSARPSACCGSWRRVVRWPGPPCESCCLAGWLWKSAWQRSARRWGSHWNPLDLFMIIWLWCWYKYSPLRYHNEALRWNTVKYDERVQLLKAASEITAGHGTLLNSRTSFLTLSQEAARGQRTVCIVSLPSYPHCTPFFKILGRTSGWVATGHLHRCPVKNWKERIWQWNDSCHSDAFPPRAEGSSLAHL